MIIEGLVRVEVEDQSLEANAAEICVIPAAAAHAFTNVGKGRARMVNINAAPRIITEFIAEASAQSGYAYNKTDDAKGRGQ